MSRHTSLRMGGPAGIAVRPSERSMGPLLSFLSHRGIPFVVVGEGTNIVVRDGGVEGAVVFTHGLNRPPVFLEGEGRVVAGAGCLLSGLIGLSLLRGLSGAEGLVGIPGSIGGAVAGNAGSFGFEIKDALYALTLVYPDGTQSTLRRHEVSFGYRSAGIPSGAVIIESEFLLTEADPVEVRDRVRSFMKEKRSRQPVTAWSAGCVFRNPRGLSAGRLIDEAGCKGMAEGGIEVSRLHANYFINTGTGSAADFLRLMERVAGRVAARFGVSLEPEVKILGRD